MGAKWPLSSCAGSTDVSPVGPTGILPIDNRRLVRYRESSLQRFFFTLVLLFFTTDLRADRRPLALDHSAQIGDGIVWFVPKGYNANTNPSLALVNEPREQRSTISSWSLKPDFFSENGKTIATIKTP